ncbi:MAG TPA: MBOAT family O-acyltransferase [Steroidobacteraceae bacterium]
MLFTSGEFLFLFLPITLLVFFATARFVGKGPAAAWLAIASLVFYGYWRVEHTLLLVASIAFNYTLGEWILRARQDRPPIARALLTFAIAANLAALAYFKYADFFIGTVAELSGRDIPLLGVVLPLGISFFTFTQIAYLVDVWAGKVVERNPVHYALFVTYFPHLIAGPVLHHAEMMPQFRLASIYSPRLRSFTIGLAFLLLGLVKKVLVADSVAPIANMVFGHDTGTALSASAAWIGVVAYTLQIYFDFSGYSDMAVGLSLLIGVRLPYNFNSPYQAWNITEFWRRWHMTLSRFLRDYLYVPLGGNRHGRARRYINLMLTMLLGGLWHGASWTFVFWGGLHGAYLVVNHFWLWLRERMGFPSPGGKRTGVRGWLGRAAGVALTMLCVMVGWVYFRATELHIANGIVASMFGLNDGGVGIEALAGYSRGILPWLAGFSLLALFARNSQLLIDGHFTQWLERRSAGAWFGELMALLIGAMCVGVVLMAVAAASRNVTEFIYFNF